MFFKRRRQPVITEPVPVIDPRIRLDEVKQFSLPPNPDFQAMAEAAERIEGMFSRFSMAVMDMMLGFQRSAGNMLEIGTYRGRSARFMADHLGQGEELTLVDVQDILDRDALAPMRNRMELIVCHSENLRAAMPEYESRKASFRFIHIDASHGFEATYTELAIADELLKPGGIIAMDDFTNLNYSQNIAAIFRYLFTTETALTVLLVTDEKAYLCREADFDMFAAQIFERGVAEIGARGFTATLARTGVSPKYRAYYLRQRESGECHFYGEEIYYNQLAFLPE